MPRKIEPYDGRAEGRGSCSGYGKTEDIWYYEQPIPEGRKKYSKTSPLIFEEFAGCIEWYGARTETDCAWHVPVDKVLAGACNLDLSNPRGGTAKTMEAPAVLIAQAIAQERQALDCLDRIAQRLQHGTGR
jgi:type I restriction enzyme M protein